MRLTVIVAIALGLTGVAQSQTMPPEKAFGSRDDVQQVSLSPDGMKVAFIGSTGTRGSTLYVIDMAVSGTIVPKAIISASGNPDQLQRCDWVSDARLICNSYEVMRDRDYIRGVTKLFAINADGTGLKRVSLRQGLYANYLASFGGAVIDLLPGDDGAVLVGRSYVPEDDVASRIKKTKEGYGVDRVDTRTLASTTVVRPEMNADEYISDGLGHVRIKSTYAEMAGGYLQPKSTYWYRTDDRSAWRLLSEYDYIARTGFYPSAVDPAENVAYGFERDDGRFVLAKFALDGSMKRTVVFSRPDVDIDGLERIGRKQRIIGVSYATDKRYIEYFDPALDRLSTALAKALPDTQQIEIVDANLDETRLVVRASSDNKAGRFYYLDRKTSRMSELFSSRAELDGYALATVKPVEIRAHDGTMVPGYLTLPPGSSGRGLPAIVMPHGGPSARDEWGFDWLPQYFANRGYAVLQPNFRGSAGYGDEWFAKRGFQSWEMAIGDVADAGRWLVAQGIADPRRLGIVGWSYGGYAALQSGVVAPDLFKAIVAVAPVTDFALLKQQSRNYTNYRGVQQEIGTGPHIVAGSPAQHADQFRVPVLMFHGDLDQNVSIFQSKLMEDKLKSAGKPVELVVYPGLTHSLDDSQTRAAMLAKSDAFLRQSMGM